MKIHKCIFAALALYGFAVDEITLGIMKKANRMLKANRKLDLSKKAKATHSILKTEKI